MIVQKHRICDRGDETPKIFVEGVLEFKPFWDGCFSFVCHCHSLRFGDEEKEAVRKFVFFYAYFDPVYS